MWKSPRNFKSKNEREKKKKILDLRESNERVGEKVVKTEKEREGRREGGENRDKGWKIILSIVKQISKNFQNLIFRHSSLLEIRINVR